MTHIKAVHYWIARQPLKLVQKRTPAPLTWAGLESSQIVFKKKKQRINFESVFESTLKSYHVRKLLIQYYTMM